MQTLKGLLRTKTAKKGELMTEYKAGDIVQLRSGGPQMTVAHVIEPDVILLDNDKLPSYACTWFKGEDLRRDTFKPHELVSDR